MKKKMRTKDEKEETKAARKKSYSAGTSHSPQAETCSNAAGPLSGFKEGQGSQEGVRSATASQGDAPPAKTVSSPNNTISSSGFAGQSTSTRTEQATEVHHHAASHYKETGDRDV
jgi:hypothetical protein